MAAEMLFAVRRTMGLALLALVVIDVGAGWTIISC
jgi:hypothetical protein